MSATALDIPAMVEELLHYRRAHVVRGQLVDTAGGVAVVERVSRNRVTGRTMIEARTGDGKLYFFEWE